LRRILEHLGRSVPEPAARKGAESNFLSLRAEAEKGFAENMLPMTLIKILRPVKRFLQRAKRKLLSNSTIRNLRDELNNEIEFEDLRSHEIMLADAIRMNAYHAAIRRNVNAGDVVVDLGTGTGILSMFAAQQNPKVVHSIDYSKVISVAERIASENHFGNIAFHHINSRRFILDESVDVILHEQIGSALLNEGMVEKTLDLKKRLLKKSGKILPGKFELFLEPVCVKNDYRIPYLWETRTHGIDFSSAKDSPESEKCKLANYNWHPNPRSAVDYFLCDAAPILAFDLNEIGDPTEIPKTMSASRVVRRHGRMDGFCLYFRVIFDAEVEFDTSPFSPRTHWDNLLFRSESRQWHEGDAISYTLEIKDRLDIESWIVRVEGGAPGVCPSDGQMSGFRVK